MGDIKRIALLWAGILLGIFLALKYVLPYIAPFIIALILAAIIDPAVNLLERRLRLARGLAVLIVMFVLTLCLAVFIVVGASRLYLEIENLVRALPGYDVSLSKMIDNIIREIERFYHGLPAPVISAIELNRYKFYQAVERSLLGVLSFAVSLPSVGFILVVAFIATYFISRDKEMLVEFMFRLLPSALRAKAGGTRAEVIGATMGFLRAQVILISFTVIISIIGLTIARVPYAWLLGILAGILDPIPIVGPGTIMVPIMIYDILVDRLGAAIVLALTMVAMFIVRRIAEPRVVAAGVGMHPLAVLVAIYVGIQLLGPGGFILGPLVAILLKALVRSGLLPLWPED
ncbi:MAG TPA: sporulation integral membrane protein YtvI [Firmicutes bacterium]|nr:sporulation integral membrane protein YtvI [Bacillota bacterium]